MELKLGLHLTPTHLTHPLFDLSSDCVQHCVVLICLIRHPSASFIVCKMRQIRAFLSYFGFRSRQNNPCDVLGAMPGRLLPQAFYATHHCQSQHCLCHLQQWLNIQQRESRLWTKWAALERQKGRSEQLRERNSGKFLPLLMDSLIRVRDRNVWLATNSIVFFQTEGY